MFAIRFFKPQALNLLLQAAGFQQVRLPCTWTLNYPGPTLDMQHGANHLLRFIGCFFKKKGPPKDTNTNGSTWSCTSWKSKNQSFEGKFPRHDRMQRHGPIRSANPSFSQTLRLGMCQGMLRPCGWSKFATVRTLLHGLFTLSPE